MSQIWPRLSPSGDTCLVTINVLFLPLDYRFHMTTTRATRLNSENVLNILEQILHFDLSQKAEKRCWTRTVWDMLRNQKHANFCKNGFLLGSWWVWLFQSNAVIEMQPKKMCWLKGNVCSRHSLQPPHPPSCVGRHSRGFLRGKVFSRVGHLSDSPALFNK